MPTTAAPTAKASAALGSGIAVWIEPPSTVTSSGWALSSFTSLKESNTKPSGERPDFVDEFGVRGAGVLASLLGPFARARLVLLSR